MHRPFWASLKPPGSSPLVGALLGLAGIQASLQAEQTFAEGEALRILLTRGWDSFIAVIAALPDPPWTVWLVNTLWAALLLAGSGGWIRSMLDDASGVPMTEDAWKEGMQRTPAAIATWLLGLAGSGLLLMGAALIPMTLYQAQMDGRLPGEDAFVWGIWSVGSGLSLLFAWWAASSLAIATLAAIHRVSAPAGSPVLGHARQVFRNGKGIPLLGRVVLAWGTWSALRAGIGMSLPVLASGLPMLSPLPGPWTLGWSVAGALACVGVNLVDSILVLWTLREACNLYSGPAHTV